MNKEKKLKKPHPVVHSIGLVFAIVFLIAAIVLNLVMSIMGSVLEGFVGGTKPKVAETIKAATTEAALVLSNEIQAEGTVLLQN